MDTPGELATVFDCAGDRLVGILHRPRPGEEHRIGVLVVVGGPQYRVGSHRQFLLLGRRLSDAGYAVFRFDYRGMGDSSGVLAGFEHIEADVAAAIDEFHRLQPGLERVVLWGLCDAASAALLHGALHPRLHGLVLLNPWVTEGETDSAVMVRHYYLEQLRSRSFWRRVVRGEVRLARAVRGLVVALAARFASSRDAAGPDRSAAPPHTLSERMARGLAGFSGPVLLITSGRDLTAAEFLDRSGRSESWRRELACERLQHVHFPDANHTFSSAARRAEVEALTLQWLARLESGRPASDSAPRESAPPVRSRV